MTIDGAHAGPSGRWHRTIDPDGDRGRLSGHDGQAPVSDADRHLPVLAKERDVVMDLSTVGIPVNSPDG